MPPADSDDGDDTTSRNADSDDTTSRHDRLQRQSTAGPHNSLWGWVSIRSPWRVVRNYLVVWLIRLSPSLRLKNWLLRRLGGTVRAMIGAGATVLPGVRIGAGAQVAANSLVTRDVPPETTVAGVPAEPIANDGAADSD